VLFDIAGEIIENLDLGFSGAVVDGSRIDRAESLMWLWTLGAYEVVRTMCQAKSCFSSKALGQLTQLKKTLAAVRMPAAKMEKAGKKAPVTSNRSPVGWDVSNRDLLVNDPESEPNVSARSILMEFDRVFSSRLIARPPAATKTEVACQREIMKAKVTPEGAYQGKPEGSLPTIIPRDRPWKHF
jgi:hypothetical protein